MHLKRFIYNNLPYLLLAAIALGLLLTDQQISLGLSRSQILSQRGVPLSLTGQHLLALAALLFAAWKILARPRR